MEWAVLLTLLCLLAIQSYVGLKLRARFLHLDERLGKLESELRRVAHESGNVEKGLRETSLEIQNASALTSLGFRFPVFLGEASIDSFHARHLVQELVARRPKTILELGSGSSTCIIARAIQLMGVEDCKHISVDHEVFFLDLSRRYAELNGLANRVVFRHCPLEHISSVDAEWYSGVAEALEGREIDLLVVDGPPAWTPDRAGARYPALPVLYAHLSRHCTVIVDDANRPGEADITRRWLAEYPDFKLVRHKQGKGLAVLTRT